MRSTSLKERFLTASLATLAAGGIATVAAPSASAMPMNVRSAPNLTAPVIGGADVDCTDINQAPGQTGDRPARVAEPSGGFWYAIHGGWVLDAEPNAWCI